MQRLMELFSALNLVLKCVLKVHPAYVLRGVAQILFVDHIFPLLFLHPEHRHNLRFCPRLRESFQRVKFRACANEHTRFGIFCAVNPDNVAGATVFNYFGNRCNFHAYTSPMV